MSLFPQHRRLILPRKIGAEGLDAVATVDASASLSAAAGGDWTGVIDGAAKGVQADADALLDAATAKADELHNGVKYAQGLADQAQSEWNKVTSGDLSSVTSAALKIAASARSRFEGAAKSADEAWDKQWSQTRAEFAKTMAAVGPLIALACVPCAGAIVVFWAVMEGLNVLMKAAQKDYNDDADKERAASLAMAMVRKGIPVPTFTFDFYHGAEDYGNRLQRQLDAWTASPSLSLLACFHTVLSTDGMVTVLGQQLAGPAVPEAGAGTFDPKKPMLSQTKALFFGRLASLAYGAPPDAVTAAAVAAGMAWEDSHRAHYEETGEQWDTIGRDVAMADAAIAKAQELKKREPPPCGPDALALPPLGSSKSGVASVAEGNGLAPAIPVALGGAGTLAALALGASLPMALVPIGLGAIVGLLGGSGGPSKPRIAVGVTGRPLVDSGVFELAKKRRT